MAQQPVKESLARALGIEDLAIEDLAIADLGIADLGIESSVLICWSDRSRSASPVATRNAI
jgi:hypothetical protein